MNILCGFSFHMFASGFGQFPYLHKKSMLLMLVGEQTFWRNMHFKPSYEETHSTSNYDEDMAIKET